MYTMDFLSEINNLILSCNSVISPDAELQLKSQSIEQGIHTQCLQDCSFSHCISKDDVIRAVKHLNPGKSGGASGVMSDSVIHGTNMLRHGISLDEFLVSILISIPKGHQVDTGNSSNYRAVAFSVQQEELKTSVYNSTINLNLQQLCAVP